MKLIPSIGVPSWASSFKLVTAVCDGCQRSITTRHPSGHNHGIRMHEGWYCGARCFTAAAEKVISLLLAPGSEPSHRAERMPLGLLLVSRGLITLEQLKRVAQEQKESGSEIGTVLLRQGIVSEKEMAAALATQWNCPLFGVPRQGVSSGIHIPPVLSEVYSAISLHYGAATNQLMVGFVHGVDYGLLYAIEHIAGCKTQPCFVTPGDFQIQRVAQSKSQSTAPSMFEARRSAGEMAQSLCKAALEMEAHEAVISKCKSYLWARVRRDSVALDLLFRI